MALGRVLVGADASTQAAGRRPGREPGGEPGGEAAVARPDGRVRLPWAGWKPLVVAGRDLRYYWRDPRRRQQVFSLVIPVFWILISSRTRLGGGALSDGIPAWPAVLAGAVAGQFSGANQFGFEGASFWLTIVTTGRWQDLRAQMAGTALAGLVITVPLFGALYAALALISGDPAGAVTAFSLAVCALGATSAVSAVTSVLVPAPVPERRASSFGGGGSGQGCLAGLAMLAGLAVSAVLLVPALVAEVAGLRGIWMLLVGPAYGAVLAWAGRMVAARIGYRRMPEILAVVAATI